MNRIGTAAIVLAGGKGKRMQTDQPKQYLLLGGYPLLFYSLKVFEESPVDTVILVAAKGEEEYCRREIVEKYGFRKVSAVVTGGKERYHSVYEGLKALEKRGGAEYVLVHDGARPLIDDALVERILSAVQKNHACVAAVPAKDTFKLTDEEGYVTETLKRDRLWQVQTPQAFSYDLLMEANEKLMRAALTEGITDDAMIVERMTGHRVQVVEGSYRNIKVTTPEDMGIAAYFLNSAKNEKGDKK